MVASTWCGAVRTFGSLDRRGRNQLRGDSTDGPDPTGMDLRHGSRPHRGDRPRRSRHATLGLAPSLTSISSRPTGPFLPDGQTLEQDPDPPPGLVPFPGPLARPTARTAAGAGQRDASAGRPASGVGTSSSLIATIAASTR